MAKTIIQTIGPLYGDVVNGTVFGRPNGSVFVPLVNTITQSLVEESRYIRNTTGINAYICDSAGTIPYTEKEKQIRVVAQSQDSQNYIQLDIAKDSDFTDILVSRILTAGMFNTNVRNFAGTAEDIIADEKYYLRAVLVASTGVAVAISDTIELVGVVVS